MQINKYFNCNQSEIDAKKFNIYLGISLGNKFFSKENLKKYLDWAFDYTKERILFVIADTNHAKNYEVFNDYSPEKALRHALRDGDKVVSIINEIIADIPKDKRDIISIVRWADLQNLPYYKRMGRVVFDEFKTNQAFQDFVLNVVKENLKDRASELSIDQKKKLAEYVLDEIPVMVNGIEFNNYLYNLYPYPGAGSYDDLLMGLQNKTMFIELANKLVINNRTAEIEAFVG
ncbi:MAG: tRNA-dependent cyclodipeptide synthase [Candidatus Taylorbacteria bacterium]|nr:tRNA-dependent cyclodipeptide synthase [Candidatus Taylorbacteria bacterium]